MVDKFTLHPLTDLFLGDTVLGTTAKEKDLGFTISADMKVSEQCGIAASNSWVD